jgi:hypothetical protein
MAEEYSDRFQNEVMRLLGTLIQKVDGHDQEFIKIGIRFDKLEAKVDVLSGQMTEVVSKVIEIDKRLSVRNAIRIARVSHYESRSGRKTSQARDSAT